MRAFRDLPIRQKLRRILLATIFVMGTVGLVAEAVDHWQIAQDEARARLASLASVIVMNSTPAMLFGDRRAAQENLGTLAAIPDVVGAVLYDKRAEVFARYTRSDPGTSAGEPATYLYYVAVSRDITAEGQNLGRIVIHLDLAPKYREVGRNLAVIAVAIVLIALVALFLFERLQRTITGPLLRLTDTMVTVSKRRDYALRVHKEAEDEIGTLVEGFNDMLAGIQARDAELVQHRAHLEEEVAQRTAELQQAKKTLEASLVEKEALVRKLDELATRDGLTGLYNRRMFHELLAHELARAKRFNRPLSLLMVDIDHFKRVNDTHGHQAGDVILKGLGNLLNRQVRTIDHVCRYGGEEITVILPETEGEGALNIAERLRAVVEQESFDIGDGRKVAITVSVGLASWPAQADAAEPLMMAADTAMYAAKESGRNRVCRYEPTMPALAVGKSVEERTSGQDTASAGSRPESARDA